MRYGINTHPTHLLHRLQKRERRFERLAKKHPQTQALGAAMRAEQPSQEVRLLAYREAGVTVMHAIVEPAR